MMLRPLVKDVHGATAAEFALVLPLLLIFMFGIIDGGRFVWEFNRAEKATQVGARVAIVTDSVPSGLQTEDYVGATVNGVTLTQGDVIPASALGEIACTRDSCTCVTEPCPADVGTINTSVFDDILIPRMQAIDPKIQAGNVLLHYTGSGLGFAGDPNGMEIAPTITVELTGLQFIPLTSLMLATLQMPGFRTSLTAEDANGTQSN